MSRRSGVGRPDWLSFALWEQFQLEGAPEDAALLREIVARADVVQERATRPSSPGLVEVRLDRRIRASDCGFYDLVLAMWLIARRARTGRSAGRWVEAEAAFTDGVDLLLFANERRRTAYTDVAWRQPATEKGPMRIQRA